MPKKEQNVTIRVRIGESEIEVTGSSSFAEKKIAEFLEQRRAQTVSSAEIATKTRGTTNIKGLSVAQFFKKLSPKTAVDRVLGAGYFLEAHKNLEKFTAAEIKETIREAKVPPPDNTNEAINKNIKKGLMMAAGDKDGKMAFVLTSDGEETINSLINVV